MKTHKSGVVALLFAIGMLTHSVCATAGARRLEEWPSESFLEASSASAATFTPFLPAKPLNRDLAVESSFTESLYTMTAPSTFRFQNTKGQFVKMPVWLPKRSTSNVRKTSSSNTISPLQPPPGSTFTFQFRTSQPNGLLLYLDDGGPREYMELALRRKVIELRFKFGDARSVKLSVGNDLDDRRWHSVSMQVKGTRVTLGVDDLITVGSAEGPAASPITPRSFCYLGGIPSMYKLMDLSLPSVFFEGGLRGAIRRYAIDGKYQRPMEKYQVIEETGSDLCYTERNPCKNNGHCYVLNNEPACDCSDTRFSGRYCEGKSRVANDFDLMMSDQAYEEAAATFLGGQWLEYDMSTKPISSFEDTITLFFKTKQSNGLMLHTGKSADFVNLSIKNGGISLVVNLGSGAYEVLLKPTVGSFNDNKWHFLKVYRELRREKSNGRREGASVNLTVDNAHTTAGFTQDDYTQLTLDDVFYIGGSPSTSNLPGSPDTNNFIGCLKEVTYKNNDNTLQLSRMAKERDRNIRVRGGVEFRCMDIDVSGPVTFKTSNSFLKLNPWSDPSSGGMKLDFKTTEPHGLLLYGSGIATRDFIALELYNGFLYILINLGSGVKKARAGTNQPLNDGNWHHISMKRDQTRLSLNIDDQELRMSLVSGSKILNLKGPLYLGGTDFDAMGRSNNIPKGLWTASLRYGFVGCVRDVYIDGVGVDIKVLAKENFKDQTTIAPECENLGKSACQSQPCKNDGKCREGWNRPLCDCAATAYTGKTCELAVSTVGFNGSQTLRFPMASTKRTQAEELNFRFKTPLSSGILLTTTSATTADRLTVTLVKGGQVKLTVDIDCSKKNCTAPRQGPDSIFQGEKLNDNKWHTVKVKRFGRRLSLGVDGKIRGSQLPSGHTELQFDAIHLGQVTGPVLPRLRSTIGSPFVGLVQNLAFNNEALIDKCLKKKAVCDFTGTWGDSNIISNAITFGDKNSYVSIATLDAYRSMTLFFTMRTTVSDGLILYNSGRGGDFVAVELVGGFIHYVYNLGNGAQIISTPDQRPINDNQWHEIRIIRDTSNTHTLSVDGTKVTQQGGGANSNLDLEGALYIGGVRQDMYFTGLPDHVASRFGFQGCLGTFDFNGISPQLLGKDRIQMSGNVTQGCTGPTQACNENSCLNGGVCRQEWNSFTCDCSMTSYAGKRCHQHISTVGGGSSYRFNGGMIVYKWPSESFPSSREDNLALGFATRERNCVLTKISSLAGTTINDYMQLEIENGRLTLRFNIGNKDVVVNEPMGVADGQYHRVTISRRWMNATLRVDNWPERRIAPKEKKNSIFNSQSMIQIGGLVMDDTSSSASDKMSWNRRVRNVVRPFQGQMTGFFFNDIGVFTLAEQGSEQVSLIGDVKLIEEPPLAPTPPGGMPFPTTMATMTTFTTSSTRPVPVKNTSKGSECDGEDICLGDTVDGAMQGDDQTSQVTPRIVVPPLATRITASSSPETTVNGSPKVTTADLVESSFNESKVNGSDNLRSGDSDPDVKTGFFGKILNGTTAMIAGIVGAAVICIVVLLAAIYKYKHRESNSFHVDEKAQNSNGRVHGNANGHAGSIVRKKNGSMNGKSLRGKEMDKEYYV